MAKIVKMIITQSFEQGVAYGVTTCSSENVFVPVKVAEAAQPEEFDTFEAVVVPNDRPGTPWMAVKIRRLDDTMATQAAA